MNEIMNRQTYERLIRNTGGIEHRTDPNKIQLNGIQQRMATAVKSLKLKERCRVHLGEKGHKHKF